MLESVRVGSGPAIARAPGKVELFSFVGRWGSGTWRQIERAADEGGLHRNI